MSKSISKYHIVSMFVFLLSLPVAVFFVMDNRVRVEFKALGFCILASFFWIILCVLLISPFFLIKEASLKAKDGSSEDIDFLINIVINKNNFYDYAARCLSSFQSSQAINLFCNKWVDNRNLLLTKILVKARYIATQPSKNRMLTALKVNKFQDCVSQDCHLVKDLLEAFEDQDIEIASRAKKYAINLSSQETIDYLFFLFFEENNQVAYQVIQQANYQATQANYKALFYILRSEWEAYEALDFDQVLLQGVYQSAAPELRKEIADKARQRGWTEWLTFASQKGKNLENMTKEEWDVTLTILKNNRNYEEMWRLVNQAPVWLCWELLVELSRCLWRSSHGYQETFEGLLALANQCSQIKIRDITNSGQLIFSVDGTYKKVKISTNGKFLATYNYYDENEDEETYYKNLKMWRIEDSQLHFSFDEIYKEISADGQFLITYNTYDTYEYKETEIRRIENGRLLFSVDGEYQEISSDGQFLITYDGAKTEVWRIGNGQLHFSVDGECQEISSDGQFLITYDDEKTEVWRIGNGQLHFSVDGVYQGISVDGQFLITYDYEKTEIAVWRIGNGQLHFLHFSVDGVYNYQGISADGQFLTTYNHSYKNNYEEEEEEEEEEETYYKNLKTEIAVWRIRDGQLLFSVDGEYQEISADGQFLITYDGAETEVWRIGNGQLHFSVDGECQGISADGQFLITYSDEKTEVRRIGDRKLLLSFNGVYQGISADWQFLITYSDEKIKLWSLRTVLIFESFIHKPVQQITLQDLVLLKELRDANGSLIYGLSEKERPWVELMIKLAEFKLSFEVEIEENQSLLSEVTEFDIEIED